MKKKYKEPLYDRYPYLSTVISIVALILSLFVILIKVYCTQTEEIERLQLLNRVTNEELQMVRQVVKEQNAKLQEKNKEIAKLESQPK